MRCISILLGLALLGTVAPLAHASQRTSDQLLIIGAMQSSDPVINQRGKRRLKPFAFTALSPRHSLAKEIVPFSRNLPPGSILVQTNARKLFYVLPGGKAIQYPVGVGRQGFTWSGTNRVSRKSEWPGWTPPPAMKIREAKKGRKLPDYMEGGIDNPLGARALYIGSTDYRIHGTTDPNSIGKAMSSGCIRMLNEHVIDLYERVAVGAKVVVE